MKDLAKRIIDNNYACVFISPHADDVMLSCATLLTHLQGKVPVTVVNVFTKAHAKPFTLSAKAFMKYSGAYKNAEALYQEREKEDREVFALLNIQPINLGLEDALFRRKKQTVLGKLLPEFEHVYPTYRWHILKRIAHNDPAIALLTKMLKKYKKTKTLVFAPYGLGNHADHKVVREVSEALFDNLILYSDFPYNQRLQTYGKPLNGGNEYAITPNLVNKTKLIKGYRTQFKGLFPSGDIPKHKEVYFSKQTTFSK